MATIDNEVVNKVKELYYDKQLSAQDVASQLGVSIDAVFYCMRKNGLVRRKKQESNAIKYERLEPSFNLRKIDNDELRILKVIGIMLYWGEGCKSEKYPIVDFANSDKDMIALFMKFLREVCGVDEKKIRIFPYFYANQNIDKNIEYWSKVTKIRKTQFTKPYIRTDLNEDKKSKMPFGLVHVRYADKKLFRLIKNWIEEYRNFK